MITNEEKVSLTNLAEGGAVELFDLELQRVLNNMEDPNVLKEAEREIILTVKLKPSDTPGIVRTKIGVKSKLAGRQILQTHMAIGRGPQGMEAKELSKPKQQQLDNVRNFRQGD